LKTLKIEDMIFDLKRFYMQNNILENLLKFIRWKKKSARNGLVAIPRHLVYKENK
jgi:hypothetical protein